MDTVFLQIPSFLEFADDHPQIVTELYLFQDETILKERLISDLLETSVHHPIILFVPEVTNSVYEWLNQAF